MIRNYIKVALRNLSKNLNYTLINIVGLAFGMACCFLIGVYIRFETGFESFHENRDVVYRFIPRSSREGELAMQTYTPAGLAPFFANEFREISAWTRYAEFSDKPVLRYVDATLPPQPLALGDSSFFRIFSFELLRGNKESVLRRPQTIVISESIAREFFKGEDPVGKQIELENKISFEVTGVFRDMPANTHLQFSYIASFSSLVDLVDLLYGYRNDQLLTDMGAWNYNTYFLIPQGDPRELEKELSYKLHEYQTKGEAIPDNFVTDWLQPLSEIHFTKGIKGDNGGKGNLAFVYIFGCIALFVLVIACFNFMNLSTALALKRAKEVGLRKTVGATRFHLIVQFLGETVFFIAIGFLIALQIVELALPFFNELMDLRLTFRIWSDPAMLSFLFITLGVTALVAGGYPALYLSSFQASAVLKGVITGSGRSGLRKTLTVGQFGIATLMIIGTVVVYNQMSYMKNAELGFDKEQVITFPVTIDLHRNFDTFRERLSKLSGVRAVTLCGGVPGRTLSHWSYRFPDGESTDTGINTIVMDYDYMSVIGLEMKEGRKFSRDFLTDDSLAYILNETAVQKFGLTNAVGTRFQVLDGRHEAGTIIGVVKDFHFRSLQHQVDPLVMRIEKDNAWLVAVKLTPGNLQEKIELIRHEWNAMTAEYPFYYSFLDDDFDKLYKSEQKIGIVMTAFSTLAIVVACLGLLGLTSFLTQQRKREIGIRKVHGATTGDVVRLLSWDFVRLVLIGFIVVAPLSWYVADRWLQNFAHRISIDPVIFVVSGLVLTTIAFLTVSYQSYKTSRCNPVDVLKES